MFQELLRLLSVQPRSEEETQQLEKFHNAMPSSLVMVDASYRFVYLNKSARKISGIDDIGHSYFDHFTKMKALKDDGTRFSLEETPIMQSLKNGKVIDAMDMNVEVADGSRIFVQVSSAPLTDKNGKIYAAVANFFDVSQVRKTNNELSFQADLLSCVQDAIIAMDDNRIVTYWNEIAEEMTGWTRQEVIGSSAGQIYPWVMGLQIEEIQNSLNTTGVYSGEVMLRKRDGTTIDIDVNARIIKGQYKQSNGIVVSFRNITERKQAEVNTQEIMKQLRKANEKKNDFIKTVSHEIRNPLAAIKTALAILRIEQPEREQVKNALKIMERQTDQLARLVDDLLDVSRITQNKIELRKEKVELNGLINSIVEDYQQLFAQKKISLTAMCPPEPIYLEADPTRMIQVVSNLLDNSSKFTRAGGNTFVSLSTDETTREATISVVDNGIGIPVLIQQNLFEPFVQVNNSLGHNNGGLGLGLTIVKGIVELHGGRVDVESDGFEIGTRFIIKIPMGGYADLGRTENLEKRQSRTLKIILIEDNQDLALVMCDLLEHLGHTVTIAAIGIEGITKAKEIRPDVVICDIGLPEMSGFDVAKILRQDKALSNTHLIAMSGYAQTDDVKQSLASGFDLHLAKPVKLDLLKQALANINPLHSVQMVDSIG